MRVKINNIISVLISFLKFSVLKLFRGSKFKFGLIERFSPNVVTEFNKGSDVLLESKVRVHSGCKIKVRKNAKLFIGKNTKINYNCIIICRDEIRIGEGTEFGPNVLIYDHDHDFRAGLKENKFLSAPIHIGKNCWIGANTVILRGTTIGDNCIIAAGSVVKDNVPDSTIYVQKRSSQLIEY